MQRQLLKFKPIAQAIAQLLHPYAEVVIHDLASQQIGALYNNFSKRHPGDESLLEHELQVSSLPDVFDVYYKTNYDGRRLRCTTATLRTDQGEAIGLLCINLDISQLDGVQQQLADFLAQGVVKAQPRQLFKDDWREKVNVFVKSYCAKEHVSIASLSREQVSNVVTELYHLGAFKAKGAATYVGDALGLSRATIYKYLGQIKQEGIK